MGRRSATGVHNGNFRGGDYYLYRKAVEADKRGEMAPAEFERLMNHKKMRASYWMQRLANAMSVLRWTDPQGWSRWFDDDSNVPADANDRQMAQMVEARARALTGSFPFIKARCRRDIFIWQDERGFYVYSKEAGKAALYVILEVETFEEAEGFVMGLPFANLGYGVVLDLLPASAALCPSTSIRSAQGVGG